MYNNSRRSGSRDEKRTALLGVLISGQEGVEADNTRLCGRGDGEDGEDLGCGLQRDWASGTRNSWRERGEMEISTKGERSTDRGIITPIRHGGIKRIAGNWRSPVFVPWQFIWLSDPSLRARRGRRATGDEDAELENPGPAGR